MTAKRKCVVRFDVWLDPAFDKRLAGADDIELTVCATEAPQSEALTALRRAHVYHASSAKDELPKRWFVTDALLEQCPNLLCVSSYGAGYDTIDVAACTRAGVAVVNQAGANADAAAEHTLGLILALSRRIVESDRRLRRARDFEREDLMGRETAGRVLGIVGIGHIGSRVASLARAFGMDVVAFDPYLAQEEIERRGARSVTLDDLLARSDIVSLHCPRDETTVGMMDARAFRRMKQGALFISTARGGIHDEAALAEALRSAHLGGAGLDVWEVEPPPLDHPMLQLDNVVATCHTAGVTPEARRNMAALAAEQIVGLLKGARPPRLVNPEVWPAYAARFESIMKATVRDIRGGIEA